MKHILLVPSKGDPTGMLCKGLCGAKPSTAVLGGQTRVAEEAATWFAEDDPSVAWRSCGPNQQPICALVLVWNGEVVNEGCDRAVRCQCKHAEISGRGICHGTSTKYSVFNATCRARSCEQLGFCNAVFIEE
jgi:hypothetical protein